MHCDVYKKIMIKVKSSMPYIISHQHHMWEEIKTCF